MSVASGEGEEKKRGGFGGQAAGESGAGWAVSEPGGGGCGALGVAGGLAGDAAAQGGRADGSSWGGGSQKGPGDKGGVRGLGGADGGRAWLDSCWAESGGGGLGMPGDGGTGSPASVDGGGTSAGSGCGPIHSAGGEREARCAGRTAAPTQEPGPWRPFPQAPGRPQPTGVSAHQLQSPWVQHLPAAAAVAAGTGAGAVVVTAVGGCKEASRRLKT